MNKQNVLDKVLVCLDKLIDILENNKGFSTSVESKNYGELPNGYFKLGDANYSDYEVLDALSYMYGEPNLTIADLNKYTPAEKAKSIIYHESAGLEPLSARTDYCKNRALGIGLKWG